MRTRFLFAAAAATGLSLLAACSSGGSDNSSNSPGGSMPDTSMPGPSASSSMPGTGMSGQTSTSDMPGMTMPAGNGLNATVNGYTLTVHQTPTSGLPMPITFTITKNGKAVTAFDPEQTKLMHLYLIRSDLTGFQHLHPAMAADGTWSATPATVVIGSYRVYVQFLPHADAKVGALVLSRPFTVTGNPAPTAPMPMPSDRGTVDGYTVTVVGMPKAGTETPLKITISKAGVPVTDLQPYLDTYAHVTAIHAGDLAFAHLHPNGTASGAHGGPTLTVNADLPAAGTYRMFVQFQTGGVLHTAALTISAG